MGVKSYNNPANQCIVFRTQQILPHWFFFIMPGFHRGLLRWAAELWLCNSPLFFQRSANWLPYKYIASASPVMYAYLESISIDIAHRVVQHQMHRKLIYPSCNLELIFNSIHEHADDILYFSAYTDSLGNLFNLYKLPPVYFAIFVPNSFFSEILKSRSGLN